ncbi:MAG: tyrosine-type recombinase/integrase, partial [Planctomycetota bacterium]
QIELLIKAAKAHYLADLSPVALDKFKAVTLDAGVAPRTVNTYLASVKAMLNWAVKRRMIPYNPLTCVAKLPETAVSPRRPLTLEEIPRLLQAALDGPMRRTLRKGTKKRKDGQPSQVGKLAFRSRAKYVAEGRRMYMIYAILMGSGLRVNELRNLRWRDVDLDTATMRLSGDWTKNGKSETLPIAPQLLDLLKDWAQRENATPDQPVIKITARTLMIFNDDLDAAGIEKVDAQGRILCLHSLRHTFGQMLNAAGVDPKTLQTLMRHSSPVLSLGIYVHRDKSREREAMAALPPLAAAPANAALPAQTGPIAKSS